MILLDKLLKILLFSLFPEKIYYAILGRIRRTKDAFYSTKELKIFWKIFLFPLNVVVGLLLVFFKTIFIWILPTSIYYNIKFIIYNLLYEDIVVKKIGLCLACERVYLFIKMCIVGREKKVSYGDKNPDKIFFVIRPYFYMTENALATSVSHLLFHYYRNLEHLSYAMEKGYIPVVDWENYGPFAHSEEKPIHGTMNCWEYYWKQPSNYTLTEVYQSKNVILSIQNSRDYGYIPKAKMSTPFNNYAKELMEKCPKYAQKFELNDSTEAYVKTWYNKLFEPEKRVLGVAIRGVSYGFSKIANHPRQPSFTELIVILKDKIEQWNIDYIFFTCESEIATKRMIAEFGDKVKILPRLRYKKNSSNDYNPLYEAGNRYQSNLDYVTEMILLSKCNCLVAGMSSGVRAALIWNGGKYEHVEIVEKGVW